MHENTPYFLIFPFFEIFTGAFAPLAPSPHGTAPVWEYKADSNMPFWKIMWYW